MNKPPIANSHNSGKASEKRVLARFTNSANDGNARIGYSSVSLDRDRHTCARGNPSDVVFYDTPELSFSPIMAKAFKDKLSQLCPQCSFRIAAIPVPTFGTSSPSVVVNDLQSHPSTKTAVFPVGEQTLGLPSAMKTAGITVDTISYSPDPQALKQVQDSQLAPRRGSKPNRQLSTTTRWSFSS
jgi:hypothetical protein